MIPPGVICPIGNNVKTEFSFWPFYPAVGFPFGHLEFIRWFICQDLPSRQPINGLLQDADALSNFVISDQKTIVHIPMVTDCDIKIKPVVDTIGISPADIIRHSGCPQYGANRRIGDGLLWGQYTDTLTASNNNFTEKAKLAISWFWWFKQVGRTSR